MAVPSTIKACEEIASARPGDGLREGRLVGRCRFLQDRGCENDERHAYRDARVCREPGRHATTILNARDRTSRRGSNSRYTRSECNRRFPRDATSAAPLMAEVGTGSPLRLPVHPSLSPCGANAPGGSRQQAAGPGERRHVPTVWFRYTVWFRCISSHARAVRQEGEEYRPRPIPAVAIAARTARTHQDLPFGAARHRVVGLSGRSSPQARRSSRRWASKSRTTCGLELPNRRI
jgi:hypothetical protein